MRSDEEALSFEELTGASSEKEWNETTLDSEYAKISSTAIKLQDLQNEVENLEQELKFKKDRLGRPFISAYQEKLKLLEDLQKNEK